MFAVKGNRIVLTTDKPLLPKGATWDQVPEWFKSALLAINSEHGLGGNWLTAPITEADKLAQQVHKFFDNPSETPVVESVRVRKRENGWERVKKNGTPPPFVWE